MKNYLLYIGCLLCLFITTSTAAYFGISNVGFTSSGLLIFLFIYTLLFEKKYFKKRNFKIEYSIIVLYLFFGIIKISTGDYESLKSGFFFMAVPMMISMLIQIQSVQTKQKIAYIILFFFILECLLAIYERLMFINFFEDVSVDISALDFVDWEFRSTSFLGHPLNNALCVSMLLGSIMISNIKEFYKIILLGLGFLSILCFNARGATIIMIFILIYYIYLSYKKYGKRTFYKMFFVFFSFIGIAIFYYLITNTSFGGRLTNYDKIFDGSAQARLGVLTVFEYFSGVDFLFGNQSLYVPIMKKLAQGGIENSYIVLILRYGIIIGLPFIIFLILYFFRTIKRYKLSYKLIIFSTFILVGSTNNGLADVSPWIIFVLTINTLPYINYNIENQNFNRNRFVFRKKGINNSNS